MIYSAIPQENGNLREHQIKAKDEILQAWDTCTSVMLQMPTGTGKTYLFTSLVSDILRYYKAHHIKLNILVVAHRTELLNQIGGSMERYGIPFGYIQAGREQHLWQRIQVASIMSLLTEKNEMNVRRLDFDYIIVDEAHHSLAETYKRLFETFPNAKKLGVTATPWRLNHESFTTLYDKLITTPQVSWFIQRGWLSDFDYVSIKPDSDIQRLIGKAEIADTGDFVNADIDAIFNNQRIRAKLLQAYQDFAAGRKGIIYAINKQHAANIAALYSANGILARAIDCDTPKDDRTRMVDEFKEGKIQVLVNVEIFTEGFDCPDVSFIQLARPTRSLALYLQQVGRGLRISEGKEKTIILDNVGLYNYFGLPDANRQWNRHFIGKETPDEVKYQRIGDHEVDLDEAERAGRSLEEMDEEMMVVRGSMKVPHHESDKQKKVPIVENIEFELADYYLVRGNKEHFRVYPFIKKRGKNTEGVANCIYVYDSTCSKIEFGQEPRENIAILAANIKAHTLVTFSLSMMGLQLKDVLNLYKLGKLVGKQLPNQVGLFELLQYISEIRQTT